MAMIIRDIPPSPALKIFVQCYRIVEFDFSALPTTPVKVYPPKPESVLLFWLDGECGIRYSKEPVDHYRQPVLVCQQTKTFTRSTTPKFRNFQIVFTATALHQLFGWDPGKLVNRHVDGESVIGPALKHLHERLQNAETHQVMIAFAESFVAQLISKKKKEYSSLDRIVNVMQSGNSVDIDHLADQFGKSSKQFRRIFNSVTGVNPKTYQRIIRFNKAYNLKNRFPELDWLTVAVHCGFYDQMHLAKDFHEFTGMTLMEFNAAEKTSPEAAAGLTSELYKSRCKNEDVPFLLTRP